VATDPPLEQQEATQLDLLDVFLRGRWRQVIFLTYTCDLPFFEAFVLPLLIQRGAQHVTIAADGPSLAERLPLWLTRGEAREAGRSYAVCGVHVPGAFYPKVVLGVGETGGAVLIGSGNVSPFGFSCGGELFSLREWAGSDVPPLAREAWHACREIAHTAAVDSMFNERVEAMGRAFPALASAPGQHVVRHNLHEPLLDQLVQEVRSRRVGEIVAWAPFADKSLAAVRALVDRLQPTRMTVALQPGLTNIDGKRLAELAAPGHSHIQWSFVELQRTTEKSSSEHALIHAKGVLVTLEDGGDLLLAGSPNLSGKALLCTAGEANLEVAVLSPGENLKEILFSGTPIRLGGEVDPHTTQWTGSAADEGGTNAQFVLMGAYWDGRVLTLEIRGDCPESARVLLDGCAGYSLVLEGERLRVPLPVSIPPRTVSLEWNGGTRGPVLVVDLPRLSENARERAEVSQQYALPDLATGGDDVVVALLTQLGEMLFTSPSDVVRVLRGLHLPTPEDEAQEVAAAGSPQAPLELSDIDFGALAQHPAARAYARSSHAAGHGRGVHSWLDQILAHFRYLQGRQQPEPARPNPVARDGDEGDAEEGERQPSPEIRRWPVSQKVRTWLRNRVRRFILGPRSLGFLRLIPPDWVVIDYVIFLNVLEFVRARAEEPRSAVLSRQACGDLSLELLSAFWGSDEEPGFWGSLDEEGAYESGLILIEYCADALTLATAVRLLSGSGEMGRRAPFTVASFARRADQIGLLTPRAAEAALAYLGSDDQDPAAVLVSIRNTLHYFDWEHYLTMLAARRGLRSARLEDRGFAQGKTLVVEPLEPYADVHHPLAVLADCLAAWQQQEPGRRVFQMLWGTNGERYVYNAAGRTWRRRRVTETSDQPKVEVLASEVDPSEFAAWPQRVVPIALSVPST